MKKNIHSCSYCCTLKMKLFSFTLMINLCEVGTMCQLNQHPCLWSTITGKTWIATSNSYLICMNLHSSPHSSKQEYQHYWTIRYDHCLQSRQKMKVACVHMWYGGGKRRDTTEQKRGGDKQAFLGKKIKQETEKKWDKWQRRGETLTH